MKLDRNKYFGETTEYDKKVTLEEDDPKSWLKSVSAFANTKGGTLFFGVADDDTIVGLDDAKYVSDKISEYVRNWMMPVPLIVLSFDTYEAAGKELTIVVLDIPAGNDTPYFYSHKGHKEAFIRIGNSSVSANSMQLRELSLRGIHSSWDRMESNFAFQDYSFTRFKGIFHARTGGSVNDSDFLSWNICNDSGKLTNMGALLADDCPVHYSRLFCTRWSGTDMSGGHVNAIDSAEYQGSVIELLTAGEDFVKKHNHLMWKKLPTSRVDLQDYIERDVHEVLVNGLVHRSYLEYGSEVHLDIFDDRLSVTSPGGMVDGSIIQNHDLYNIASKRRNPLLADIFQSCRLMERSGSGIKQILDDYKAAHNIIPEKMPKFYSDDSCFIVTFYNLNYDKDLEGHVPQGVNQDVNQGVNQDVNQDMSDKIKIIYTMITENPKVTRKEMAETIGVTARTVSRLIEKAGNIVYIGHGYSGHWEIS